MAVLLSDGLCLTWRLLRAAVRVRRCPALSAGPASRAVTLPARCPARTNALRVMLMTAVIGMTGVAFPVLRRILVFFHSGYYMSGYQYYYGAFPSPY